MQRYHAISIQKLLDGMTVGSDKTDIKTKNFTRGKDTHSIRTKKEIHHKDKTTLNICAYHQSGKIHKEKSNRMFLILRVGNFNTPVSTMIEPGRSRKY